MRRWVADAMGLMIGATVGIVVLSVYWPQVQALVRPQLGVAPSTLPEPYARQAAASPPDSPQSTVPQSAATLPTVRHPAAIQSHVVAMVPPMAEPSPVVVAPAPLPVVQRPGSPPASDSPRWAPGSAYAGTGFFIAADGSLLTAAHVVAGCTRAKIVSSHVALTTADVLAVDGRRDIALLQAPQAHPPAILPLGHPAGAGRVFVLGYPSRAGMLVAEEEWADLRSDAVIRAAAALQSQDGVWLESRQITHGYSGGPILDPRTGTVIALVRAEIEGPGLQAILGHNGSHMATGPSGERLATFVHREAPWIDLGGTLSGGEDATAAARLATVHVICSP